MDSTAASLMGLTVQIPPRNVRLSVGSVVYYQIEISSTGQSIVHGSRNDCGGCI
jgi:hypothetical protein